MTKSDLDNFDDVVSRKDQAIADLEQEVQYLKDSRNEDKFFGIFCLIILFDIAIFFHIENWAVPVSITFLQAMLLFVLGQKMGIESFVGIVNRMVDGIGKYK